jgi:hypothetical protein
MSSSEPQFPFLSVEVLLTILLQWSRFKSTCRRGGALGFSPSKSHQLFVVKEKGKNAAK